MCWFRRLFYQLATRMTLIYLLIVGSIPTGCDLLPRIVLNVTFCYLFCLYRRCYFVTLSLPSVLTSQTWHLIILVVLFRLRSEISLPIMRDLVPHYLQDSAKVWHSESWLCLVAVNSFILSYFFNKNQDTFMKKGKEIHMVGEEALHQLYTEVWNFEREKTEDKCNFFYLSTHPQFDNLIKEKGISQKRHQKSCFTPLEFQMSPLILKRLFIPSRANHQKVALYTFEESPLFLPFFLYISHIFHHHQYSVEHNF